MKKVILFLTSLVFACSVKPATMATKPYLQNMQPTEVTIMWLSVDTKGMAGWVEYKSSESSVQKAYQTIDGVRAAFNGINQVRLKNLKPGTKYSYKVAEVGFTKVSDTEIILGDTVYSAVYQFTTPVDNAPTMKCVVFNDLHSQPTIFDKLMKNNESIMPDYDFVFYNGDMINAVTSQQDIITNLIEPSIKYFASSRPFFTVKGNHEARRQWSRRYWEHFANPTTQTGRTRGYYSFSWGPCFCIVLDTGEDSDKDVMGSLYNYDPYREEEAAWLEQQLQSQAKKDAYYTIVFMHAPTYSNTSKEYHQSIHSRELFQPLFHKYGIDIMICGHTHVPGVYPGGTGHQYPILIGGGKDPGTDAAPAMIAIDANRYAASFTIYDENGKQSYQYTIKNESKLPELNGDFVLARVGDSTKTLNQAITYPVFLEEYNLHNREATLTRTIPLPTQTDGKNHSCLAIGASMTSGNLRLSANKGYLLFAGYDDAIGQGAIAKTAEQAPRVIACVDWLGNVNTTTALTNAYSKNEIRDVASLDGLTFTLSGGGTAENPGGLMTATLGATTAVPITNSPIATQQIRLFEGDLYVNEGDELTRDNQSFLPDGATLAAPADFVIVPVNRTQNQYVLYWITGTNDISKYSLVSGQWVFNGTYTGLQRPRTIEAQNADACVQLFVLSGINSANGSSKLVLLEDVGGYNKTMSVVQTVLLDISGSKTTFKSLAWKPQIPSSLPDVNEACSAKQGQIVYQSDGQIVILFNNQRYTLTGAQLQ